MMLKIFLKFFTITLVLTFFGFADNSFGFDEDEVEELRQKGNCRECELDNADLQGAQLIGADLTNSELNGANLKEADLSGATLYKAEMKGANLERADLSGANLQFTDLTGANLKGAILEDVSLVKVILDGANLEGAKLAGATGMNEQIEKGECKCSGLTKKIKLANKNRFELENPEVVTEQKGLEKLKKEEEKRKAKRKAKEEAKKMARKAKKEKRSFERKLKEYIKLTQKLKEHIESIRICCDENDKGDPKLKELINFYKSTNRSDAEGLHEEHNKFFKLSEKFSDLVAKDEAIEKNKAILEDTIAKLNLVINDVESKASYAKDRFYNETFVPEEDENTKRMKAHFAAKKELEKLSINTKLYKELTTAFEKNFMPGSAQGTINLLKLKTMGKSDGEVASFFIGGFNIYKNCLVDELPKRFTKTKLEQMENEWGTNDLEVVSITMKCEPIVARELEKYLLGQ